MQLYSVSDEYINFLKSKFPRVYSNKEDTRVHTRKYLGVVIEIDAHKYYIPLSSPKEKHDYIIIDGKKTIRKDSLIVMRIVSGTGENKELKGTLQIGTMIPVPNAAIKLYDVDNEPDRAYKDLVNEEIIYIRKHDKVSGFDISPTSVEITNRGLIKCGIDFVELKAASILDTGYENASFDAVNAHAVLDHLTVADAKKAIDELFRIIRKDGLVIVSFDSAEEEDFLEEHVEIEPGTMQYVSGERTGMLFHPYEWVEISRLLVGHEIIETWTNQKEEKIVVLRK